MRTRWIAMAMAASALCACQGDQQCTDWAGGNGFSSWGSCGDKRDRKVECDIMPAAGKPAPAPGADVECRCYLGGVVGKSFKMKDTQPLGTIDSATTTANEQCGWDISR